MDSDETILPGASPQPGPATPTVFGPYEVVRELARGGQGMVLEARDTRSDRAVALKVLLKSDAKGRKRFRQEAQVLARLQHPNLPVVHDLGEEGKAAFIAMQLVKGQDLAGKVEAQGPPAWDWSARVMAEVARAVQYCHDAGLVHRDLKPANVMLEGQRPMLVDFGLVKRDTERFRLTLDERSRFSVSGEVKGTPAYMAPEQVDKGEVGPWTDVYALGGVLFFLLVGEPPFEESSFYALMRQVLREPPPDPRATNPDVPEELAALCLQALSKDPGDRPVSAAMFAEALDALVEPGEPQGSRSSAGWAVLAVVLLLLGAGAWAFAVPPAAPEPEEEQTAAVDPPAIPKKSVVPPVPKMTEKTAGPDRRARAQEHLTRGLKSRAQDPAAAIAAFTAALTEDPDFAPALQERGKAHFAAKDYDRALADYTAYLKLRPADAGYWNNRGFTNSKLGRPKAAVDDYTKAIELNGKFARAYCNRAWSRWRLNDVKGAARDYAEALRINPKYKKAACNLIRTRLQLREGAGALEAGEYAVKTWPLDFEARFMRGKARVAMGLPTRARMDFETARDLAKTDEQRANAEQELKKLDASER